MAGVLTVIGPALAFYWIKYNLWQTVYGGDPNLVIKGYSLDQMMQYQIWTLLVALLAQSHHSRNLSEDIRLGRISSYLVYPFKFWEFHTASFLATQFVQIMIFIVSFLIFIALGILDFQNLESFLFGFGYTLVVAFFWFSVMYGLGLLSFWLEETWIMRVMFSIIATFLSGSFIPLELFPTWLTELIQFSPFPYLTHFPIKVFMGQATELMPATIILLFGQFSLGLSTVVSGEKA